MEYNHTTAPVSGNQTLLWTEYKHCVKVKQSEERIVTEITREEERFVATIAAGQNMLSKVMERSRSTGGVVGGPDSFMMYDTFGFPLELTQEVAAAEGLSVDVAAFEVSMREQRQRSKVRLSYIQHFARP